MHKEKAAERGNVQAARECITDSAHNNPSPNPLQDAAARMIVASIWLRHALMTGDHAKTRDAYQRAHEHMHTLAAIMDGGEA